MQRLRRVLGLDADALAGRARLGVDVLSQLEAGEREPTFGELRGLALGLGMSLGTLFRVWEQQQLRDLDSA